MADILSICTLSLRTFERTHKPNGIVKGASKLSARIGTSWNDKKTQHTRNIQQQYGKNKLLHLATSFSASSQSRSFWRPRGTSECKYMHKRRALWGEEELTMSRQSIGRVKVCRPTVGYILSSYIMGSNEIFVKKMMNCLAVAVGFPMASYSFLRSLSFQ